MPSPKVPSCGMSELSRISMCITWLQFGILEPNMTNWRQLGLQFGPKQCNLGPGWPLWGSSGPMRHKLAFFYRYFQCFLALMGFVVQGLVANIRLVTQLRRQLRQLPPHRTKLRILSPTCVQTCPSRAMLDTSWAQVGANWPEFGASYTQVGPKWAPV